MADPAAVDPATAATLVVVGLASFFMAWSIGAGSSGSTPFAPAVGANAISIMRAGLLVGVLGFAGAVLQGANVSEAVGRELIRGVSLSPVAATVGLLTAALLVALGVFKGYPIATAFTVTGAVVGVGLAMGGDPAWAKYREITALWVLTPVGGGGGAYLTARLLRDDRVADRTVVPVLAAIVAVLVANVEFSALGPPDGGASMARAVAVALGSPTTTGLVAVSAAGAALAAGALYWALGSEPEVTMQRFLVVLGGLVAFSAGGTQVGLAVGPLIPLLEPYEVPLTAILVGGGIGLLAGSWTGAPRMIKALSQDYSSLGPRRSVAALIPSFAIAQTAVFFGIPVSFNEIVVSAIVGSGYAAGGSAVSGRKMGYTVLAWIGSLLAAGVAGYLAFLGIASVT
ncbi:anion permease [Halobacteriales archaeon QS_8_69_26]|nr:MAG: anion permease [Halobacteriales archaeon QS_8_69_26]